MPQVHIVAYCGDLGYGAARGAQMLSLMLGFGIVSRLAFGWICDRIGGLRTLLLGSAAAGDRARPVPALRRPGVALRHLGALRPVPGRHRPAYAIIVREFFPPREAGARVGIVMTATLFGMALGGWMSGAIFDLTGSYRAAFINGILWNLLNVVDRDVEEIPADAVDESRSIRAGQIEHAPDIQPPSAMPKSVAINTMPTRAPGFLRREVLADDDRVRRNDAALEQAEQRRDDVQRRQPVEGRNSAARCLAAASRGAACAGRRCGRRSNRT